MRKYGLQTDLESRLEAYVKYQIAMDNQMKK